jgi:phosphate uptake regulator
MISCMKMVQKMEAIGQLAATISSTRLHLTRSKEEELYGVRLANH